MDASVLIVDDEPRISAALMTRLEAAGYDVFHAHCGTACLEALELRTPDVIVMDVRMPDFDGIETCRRMRRNPEHATTPVIFLTAHAQEDTKQRALEVGGCTFLTKPFESAELLAAVEYALNACSNPSTQHKDAA